MRRKARSKHPNKRYSRRKTRYSKKKYFKGGPVNRASLSARSAVAFPKTNLVKMRYTEYLELDPTNAGAIEIHQFRANSIYDPNLTGAGHQPLGHDQWQTFYDRYTVIGSKINIMAMSKTENNTVPNVFGVYTSDTQAITAASVPAICEQGLSTWKTLPSALQTPRQINGYFSAKKYFQLKDIKDNQNRYGADFGGNPAEQAYFNVWCGAMDGVTDTSPASFLITIDYLVLCSEPNELPQS